MMPPLSERTLTEHLLRASRMAGSLRPEHRLDTKIDMRPSAVESRLREASDLLATCHDLGKLRPPDPAR
jgi:hypothetical protein